MIDAIRLFSVRKIKRRNFKGKKYYKYTVIYDGKLYKLKCKMWLSEQKIRRITMTESFKLYQLPERQNVKLYFDDNIENKKDIVVIFDHIDGFYSYCWYEEDRKKLVHIKATTQFKKYKDGYKCVEGIDE